MARFIELDKLPGQKVLINIDRILFVRPASMHTNSTTIYFSDKDYIAIDIPYSVVVERLKKEEM